jgi:hypothetical protein
LVFVLQRAVAVDIVAVHNKGGNKWLVEDAEIGKITKWQFPKEFPTLKNQLVRLLNVSVNFQMVKIPYFVKDTNVQKLNPCIICASLEKTTTNCGRAERVQCKVFKP